MSKIYEALERAQRHKLPTRALPSPSPPAPAPSICPDAVGGIRMEEEMLGLCKRIDSLLPDDPKRILQFIGSREGEGTSTIVREFARVVAERIGKSVLLLDADRTSPSHHLYFRIQPIHFWQDAVSDIELLEKVLHRIGESSLYIGPSANSASATPQIFDSPRINDFWQALWDRFDLILIDSSPLTTSPDGLAIAPRVHGVLLVLEAEKTRWQIAKSVHDRLTNVGGNVLGIVFNKRKYYIPGVIYRNL